MFPDFEIVILPTTLLLRAIGKNRFCAHLHVVLLEDFLHDRQRCRQKHESKKLYILAILGACGLNHSFFELVLIIFL